MAKLNFMDRENLLREYEIKEEITTIGREATNVIVIADPSVSRQHATVDKKEDGYYLVDKNSSNGTFINGKKITRQKLSHQDKLNLGNASMVFEDEEQVAATFILPRSEMPMPEGLTRAESPRSREEEPTNSIELPPMAPPPRPTPPKIERQPTPPPPPPGPAPKPATPAPAAAAPKPEAAPTVCPSCKKPIEPGSRFCGFCGSSLSPAKPAAPPPAPPPVAGRQSFPPEARSPIPPTPQAPKPPAGPPPPVAPRKPAGVAAPVTGLNYAGFAVRLVAYLIDTGILLLLLLVPLVITIFLSMRNAENPSPLNIMIMAACSIIMMVISIGYQLYFIGAKGATPGKKIMKLKVTLADGTFPIGYGKAFLRMIGYAISGLICYIGFLMIALDKEQHRGLHDRIAGTVVIKET